MGCVSWARLSYPASAEDRGAGGVHVIEPLAHRRAAALELGAKDVSATADDFVSGAG
jgi:hypothetical protein